MPATLIRISRAVFPLLFTLLAWLTPVAHAEFPPPQHDDWAARFMARVRLTSTPPYRTQLDDSRFALSNCGPATLGMILDAYGVSQSTLDLRQMTHTYQGTWPGRGGTALQHMAHVAEDLGVPTHGLYDVANEEFHRWSVDEIAAELVGGRWVIPLVRYGSLPGHESSGVRTGHYVVIYAQDGAGFTYHDPAYRPVSEGVGRWISREQLDRAMDPVLVPRQAVALGA